MKSIPCVFRLGLALWFCMSADFPGGGSRAATPQDKTAPPQHKPDDPSKTRALLPPPNDYNFVHPPSVPCGENGRDPHYQVPLTVAQEKRALEIYRKSFVILAHVHCVERWDFEEMNRAGISAVILKVDTDGVNLLNGTRSYNRTDEDWVPRARKSISRVQEMAAEPGAKIMIVRTIADLHRAKRDGKVGVIFSFEGAKPLLGRMENLKDYYALGLRELQLWWAVPNELKTPDGRQFSSFGEDVIREMNRLGIVIDLSHMSGQAFGRAIQLSTTPVIISHCSVAALFGNPKTRSYDDPQKDGPYSGTDQLNDVTIRAMAKNGGAICVHFVAPDYIKLRHGTERATVVDLVDHIAYIRDLVGVDYVSLGTDFFPEMEWHWVEGANRMSMVANVAREMVRRGFTDDEISKVLGDNLVRVFQKNWKGN
jgi:membrane dipeptidase